MSFPFFLRNKKTFGSYFSPFKKFKKNYKLKHPHMVGIIRLFTSLIISLVAVALIFIFFTFRESQSLDKIKQYTFLKNKTHINPKNILLPNICFSSIYNLPIYLYMPFINDAYYYNDDPSIGEPIKKSSLGIYNYSNLFFDNNTYDIEVIGNMIKPKNEYYREEQVKMIRYNIFNKNNSNNITVLSIKGTSNKKDIFLDTQLYFASVELNLLSTFSLFSQQKDSYTFKFIEYGLSIPYRLFSHYLLIDEYLNNLLDAYRQNDLSSSNKTIIVGHSLGGGLSKIFGRFVNRQAISLSGPGVNAFHSLWNYEGQSENFEISAIDLVPDMDLVPRVEVSGGSVYRIVCKEGPVDCHSKELSLCEVLIMCRNPNYYQYCTKMAHLDDDEIKKLEEATELNN